MRDTITDFLLYGGPKGLIRYGGSKAKGTMILDDYDLDVICYFPHDDTSAGETLEDIYNNVRACLEKDYAVHPKTSALRLHDQEGGDFHIDVVPGRFTDTTKTDAYLHQNGGSKRYLKTNIQTHIDHVSESRCTDIIQLIKLWRVRSGISIRTFPMELLIIEVLKGKRAVGLEGRLTTLLTELRDNIDDYSIEDPANPTGNDLSDLLNDTVRAILSAGARSTLRTVETSGWEAVFGIIEAASKVHKVAALVAAAVNTCPCSKLRNAEKAKRFLRHRHTVVAMITILSALLSLLSFRVRSRASLELELIALRHQGTHPVAAVLWIA